MGLWDFVKNAGKSLGIGKADAKGPEAPSAEAEEDRRSRPQGRRDRGPGGRRYREGERACPEQEALVFIRRPQARGCEVTLFRREFLGEKAWTR
jgi:hypothetical protein